MTWGESARKNREDAGLSVYDLEKLSGVPRTTIKFLEDDAGAGNGPCIRTIVDLADALGLSIDTYIGHNGAVNNVGGLPKRYGELEKDMVRVKELLKEAAQIAGSWR